VDSVCILVEIVFIRTITAFYIHYVLHHHIRRYNYICRRCNCLWQKM